MRCLSFFYLLLTVFSCGRTEDQSWRKTSLVNEFPQAVGAQLQYCHSCHAPASLSHDDIIAPPLLAVKRRYLVSYPEKQAFVKAVSSFALAPEENAALMRGAVRRFGVMPKAPFTEAQLRAVAEYIYENELPQPDWFDEHFQQEHPDGFRGGRGRNH